MEKSGTLKIANGSSRVDGTLLARNVPSGQDPFGAATDFVKDNGCDDGDCVTVTGTLQDKILYIDSAKKVSADLCAPAQAADAVRLAVAAPALAGRAPATKKSANKTTVKKKSAEPKKPLPTKKAAKKSVAKSAAKKKPLPATPAKKASARGPAKKKGKRQ
jgi:hypothetical protein